jgi:hypothetical protein
MLSGNNKLKSKKVRFFNKYLFLIHTFTPYLLTLTTLLSLFISMLCTVLKFAYTFYYRLPTTDYLLFLTSYFLFLIPHSSFLIPHSSFLIPDLPVNQHRQFIRIVHFVCDFLQFDSSNSFNPFLNRFQVFQFPVPKKAFP